MSVPTDLRTCEFCGLEWEDCECVCKECGQAPCACEGEDRQLPTPEEFAAGCALAEALVAGDPFRTEAGDPIRIIRVALNRLKARRT